MEEDIRQYTMICSFVQRKYKEDILETKEMDYLPGADEKERGRRNENWGSWNEEGGCLSDLSFLHKNSEFLEAIVMFHLSFIYPKSKLTKLPRM